MTIQRPDETYWARLAEGHFGPGWAKPEPSLWDQPRRDFQVAHFRYDQARAALHEAGSFVSHAQAERRNLICVNPKEGNTYATTANLVAAYQMVGPGERARSHRHTPNALRLIVDAPPGTYTIVDGCRIDMEPGDVVLTPNWCWHGHANEGDSEAYWLDFLDVPFVQHAGPMFFEPHPLDYEPATHRDPDSPMRIPTRSALRHAGVEPGARVVPIADGRLATVGLELVAIPSGESLPCTETTANYLYAVIEGAGEVVHDTSGRSTLDRGDLIAVPSWTEHELVATTDFVMLRVSDAPVMAALGFLRDAGTAPTGVRDN